jgi:dTDP-4-dehydrorhamnose reductase
MIGAYVDFGFRPTQSELDITNEDAVATYMAQYRPSSIFHLAGATDMARCEAEPAYAYDLNVRGTYNMARAARTAGIPMVYVSTTRVFKGDTEAPYTEEDVPDPTTHYGRTKHIGELITAALVPHHIIARTAWVFGGGPTRDNKFYGMVIRKLLAQEEVVALADVYGSPTYGKDLVATLCELLMKGEWGTIHITNTGRATRYDIARELALSIRPDAPVRAVDRSHFTTGATLPTNESVTSLRCTLRPWQEALAEYISAEWSEHIKSATITA